MEKNGEKKMKKIAGVMVLLTLMVMLLPVTAKASSLKIEGRRVVPYAKTTIIKSKRMVTEWATTCPKVKVVKTTARTAVVKCSFASYRPVKVTAKYQSGETDSVTIYTAEPEVLTLNHKKINVRVGKCRHLKAIITYVCPDVSYTWSCSNTAVAKVCSNGKILGKKPGTAYITLKSSRGETARCKIRVK